MAEKKRIAVLASGSGTNFQSLIDASGSLNGGFAALITDNREAGALDRARAAGIRGVVLPAGSRESMFLALGRELEDISPDFIVMAGFLPLLPAWLTARWEGRIINIHPSLIPSFCGKGFYGARVHEAVIAAGVKVSGATVHFATAETDAGPIIGQRAVDVYFEDTPESLQRRVLEAEHSLLIECVSLLCMDKVTIEGSRVRVDRTQP